MPLRNTPIRRKLMAAFLLTGGAVLLLTCAAFLAYEIVTLRKGMVDAYATRSQILAANSTAALAFQNQDDATGVLAALQSDTHVVAACLYDDKGKLFAKYPAGTPDGIFPAGPGSSGYRGGKLETFTPVVQGDRFLGTVYIQSDLAALTERYHAYAWLASAIFAGSLLLVFLLARVLQKQISLPILVLAGTAEAISNHRDYSVRAPKLGEDELGRLTDAFNQMLEEIQAQEQALRKSEERFRALVESGEDGIVVSDSKGAALYVSPALLRMLGRAEEDFLGKSRPDLVHPDDLPYVMDKMAETLKNPGKAIQARYRLRHKDGSWRWIDMTATNLLDKPAVGGIIRNIRDVTEKLKLEEIARIGEAQAIASINDYAILMLDTEGKILTWNAGAERIKGYKASEIIGKPISVFYTPEDNARNHSKELLKAASKEGRVEDEGWRVRKDGSRFQADVIITALKNERGELRGFIKVTRDVTEIKKAQEKIRESEERFRSIIESAPSAIIVADGEGRIQTWNQQALHLFGYQEGEVLGHPLTILMPERYREAHSAGIKRVSETGRSKLIGRSVELAGLRKDGTEFPMQLSLSSWKTGEKLFYGGIIQDITDLKRQQELELYTRALEVSNKELQDFVFVASHDLQEPLRKVLSFGEFLQEEYGGKLEETGKDYLDRIRSAATRMQTLINDLLTLTRVTTKAKPFEAVDLNKVLKEVLSDLEVRIAEKKAKVEVGPLPTLEADATQMRQLFQNLIGNALKFQRPGVPPEINVEGEKIEGPKRGEGQYRIRVKDKGIGFDNKYAEQIFKVFERLHGRDEYEGTGIGLAVCRKVVERHNGSIAAEGSLGQGSTFIVSLPVRQNLKGGKV